MIPGLTCPGSRAARSRPDSETNMAPLPGSLAPRRHHITDLTLMGIRLAHTHYYIAEKSVPITLSAVTLQPVNFGQSTEVMSAKFGLPVRARPGPLRSAVSEVDQALLYRLSQRVAGREDPLATGNGVAEQGYSVADSARGVV